MLEPDTEVVIVLPAPASEEVAGPVDEAAGPEVLDGTGAGIAVVPDELIEVVSGDTMLLLLAEVAGAAELGTVVVSVVAAEEPE